MTGQEHHSVDAVGLGWWARLGVLRSVVPIVALTMVVSLPILRAVEDLGETTRRTWIPIPVGQIGAGGLIARTPGADPITVKPAQGGGFIVRQGGMLLAVVIPIPSGGFKIHFTARSLIYLRPRWGGGYTIEEAGKPTIRVEPTPEGGYIVKTVGEEPIHVRPVWGGGFTIDTPGGLSTTVSPGRASEKLTDAPVPVPVILAAR